MLSLFNKTRNAKHPIQWYIGLCVTSCCRRLEAALVGIHGTRMGSPVEIGHGLTVNLPEEIRSAYQDGLPPKNMDVISNKASGHGLTHYGTDAELTLLERLEIPAGTTTPRLPPPIREQLLEIQEETIRELLHVGGVVPSELLAIGVHDAGVWQMDTFRENRNSHSFEERLPERKSDKQNKNQSQNKNDSIDGWIQSFQKISSVFHETLCDTTALAARTGHNVIDAFPAKDLAVGGHGCPFFPLAYWALLHSPEKRRLLIDLGQETRFTFLPDSTHGNKTQIGYGSAGVCGGLIDPIVQRLTNGEQTFDDAGRLSVQGALLPELSHLLETITLFDVPTLQNHCSPFAAIFAAEQASAILEHAQKKSWSLRDVLYTVVQFTAKRIATSIRRQFGPILNDTEFLITGGGYRHAVLFRQIQQEFQNQQKLQFEKEFPNQRDFQQQNLQHQNLQHQQESQLQKDLQLQQDLQHQQEVQHQQELQLQREFPHNDWITLDKLKISPNTLDAAAVAILTSLTVNQIPGNLPHLTGADTECLLGRFLSGSPQNWQRLLQHLAAAQPAARTLRSAV